MISTAAKEHLHIQTVLSMWGISPMAQKMVMAELFMIPELSMKVTG